MGLLRCKTTRVARFPSTRTILCVIYLYVDTDILECLTNQPIGLGVHPFSSLCRHEDVICVSCRACSRSLRITARNCKRDRDGANDLKVWSLVKYLIISTRRSSRQSATIKRGGLFSFGAAQKNIKLF